jgi:hypothetical protein
VAESVEAPARRPEASVREVVGRIPKLKKNTFILRRTL